MKTQGVNKGVQHLVQQSELPDELNEIFIGWSCLSPGGKSAILRAYRRESTKSSTVETAKRGAD